MTAKRERASNILFNSEHLSFEYALMLYVEQAYQELVGDWDDDMREEMRKAQQDMIVAAEIARDIYQEHVKKATTCMRESENGYVHAIGEALAYGDYSGLAI